MLRFSHWLGPRSRHQASWTPGGPIGAPEDSADVNRLDATLLIQFRLEVPPSRGRRRRVLYAKEISNFEFNEPLCFNDISASPERYMDPVRAVFKLMRGDASGLKDAMLLLRLRGSRDPRRSE